GGGQQRCGAQDQRNQHQDDPAAVRSEQGREAAQPPAAPARAAQPPAQLGKPRLHRPATTLRSTGLRVRKTLSGRPFSTISRYSGEISSNSSWLPRAATAPSSRTTISSASAIVDSRWAITKVVRPAISSISARRISRSVVASTDDVASSRIRI